MHNHKKIIPYSTQNGKTPFIEWLQSFDKKTKAIITSRFNRIELGNYGDCKPVGEGVMELRYSFGPGYRVYFGIDNDKLIILLIGGDKSSQQRDIKKAKEFWQDYKTRRINK